MNRMKYLIEKIEQASTEYYQNDNPVLSDKEYDDLYDELDELEKRTGIILAGSPTQKVQGEVLPELQKVVHTQTMLSADKTKSLSDLISFLGNQEGVLSWKLDGLTIVLKYHEGNFIQAITRGTGGEIGEDVTHTMKTCKSLPMKIPYKEYLEVRGECFISYKNFEHINKEYSGKYKNPRNLAAGSVRQLDSNVARERFLDFKAFSLVESGEIYNTKIEQLKFLEDLGIPVVEHSLVTLSDLEDVMKLYNPDWYQNPVDGLILEFNDIEHGKTLGVTSHHPLNIMAFKWKDETSETKLLDVEWSASRTGLLNPVAIFEPVEIEGTTVSRASLHNVSIFNNLKLGIGDKLEVYKANMIIPQIHKNLTQSGTLEIPDECPVCGGDTVIKMENDSAQLYCNNTKCNSKLIGRIIHFCDKKSLDIRGISESTIETLVLNGYIRNVIDIILLPEKEKVIDDIAKMSGFGKKSVDNMVASIKQAISNLSLNRFIRAFGIPNIGSSASKEISKACAGDWDVFVGKMDNQFDWSSLQDIGGVTKDSLQEYWKTNRNEMIETAKFIIFANSQATNACKSIMGKNFCITGKLELFPNRDTLVQRIEELGGKVVSGVTKKTDYLLTNDSGTGSSKNKKAGELNIPVITEEQFIQMIESEN